VATLDDEGTAGRKGKGSGCPCIVPIYLVQCNHACLVSEWGEDRNEVKEKDSKHEYIRKLKRKEFKKTQTITQRVYPH
jgi:hypothetical protein